MTPLANQPVAPRSYATDRLALSLAFVGAVAMSVSLWLAQAALIGMVVLAARHGRSLWQRDRGLVVAFGAIAVSWGVSWACAPSGTMAFRESKDMWVLLIAPAVVIVRDRLPGRRHLMLVGLAAGASLATAAAVAELVMGHGLLRTDIPITDRATGTLGTSMSLAGVLSLVAGALLVHALSRDEGRWWRVCWAVLACVAIAGVAAAGSRAYLVTLGFVVLCALATRSLRAAIAGWGALVCVGVLLFAASTTDDGSTPLARIATVEFTTVHLYRRSQIDVRLRPESSAQINVRLLYWHLGAQCFRDHWFAGTGQGQTGFEAAYGAYLDEFNREHGTLFAVTHLHNNLLQVLVETGILGFTVLGGCMIFFAGRWIMAWRTSQCNTIDLGIAAVLGVVVLIPGLVESNISDLEVIMPLLFLFGLSWPRVRGTNRTVTHHNVEPPQAQNPALRPASR